MNIRRHSLIAMALFVLAPSVAFAGPFDRASARLIVAGNDAQLGQASDLTTIVANIINVALSFSGIVLLCYFIYAGFLWMTASGDSKQVDKAKDIIRNAVIGLLVLMSAFAISAFVFNALTTITQNSNGDGGTGTGVVNTP